MNQLKNDPDHRHPILPGFNQESCRQVKTAGNNRTPDKPASNGQRQLKADSVICSAALAFVVHGVSIHQKRKRIFEKHTESRNFMCHKTDPPGASECVDATEFRRQSHYVVNFCEKTGEIALKVRICSFMKRDMHERIYLSKSITVPCMAANWHSRIIASKQTAFQMSGKKLFRWRKNNQLICLEKSPYKVKKVLNLYQIHNQCNKN